MDDTIKYEIAKEITVTAIQQGYFKSNDENIAQNIAIFYNNIVKNLSAENITNAESCDKKETKKLIDKIEPKSNQGVLHFS